MRAKSRKFCAFVCGLDRFGGYAGQKIKRERWIVKIGLNLFSVRNLIQNEKDLLNAVLELKKSGYDYFQYSGAPFDAQMIARVSKEADASFCLTHVPMQRIVEDTDRLMEEHDLFGCKNIGLGGMTPKETFADYDAFRRQVDALEKAAERMQCNGFTFFYHHHHFEFFKSCGQTALDYMIENTRAIHFTADTYWLQYGGVNVLEYLDKMKGRAECVHLKDYMIVYRGEGADRDLAPKFAPLGDGVMNFKAIVAKAKECGAKYFFVEQDDAADLPDTLGQVARSAAYAAKEL